MLGTPVVDVVVVVIDPIVVVVIGPNVVVVIDPIVVLVVAKVIGVVAGRPQSGGVGPTLALQVFPFAFRVATQAARHALPGLRAGQTHGTLSSAGRTAACSRAGAARNRRGAHHQNNS